MSGAPSSGKPWESHTKNRYGTECGLKKGPVDTEPAGSVFGEHSFYQETRGPILGIVMWLKV